MESITLKELKTAEEFIKENRKNDFYGEISNTSELMIEFAKMHATEALKQASDKAVCYLNEHHPDEAFTDRQSILNAYPLDQIK